MNSRDVDNKLNGILNYVEELEDYIKNLERKLETAEKELSERKKLWNLPGTCWHNGDGSVSWVPKSLSTTETPVLTVKSIDDLPTAISAYYKNETNEELSSVEVDDEETCYKCLYQDCGPDDYPCRKCINCSVMSITNYFKPIDNRTIPVHAMSDDEAADVLQILDTGLQYNDQGDTRAFVRLAAAARNRYDGVTDTVELS